MGTRERIRKFYGVTSERSVGAYHGATSTESGERIGIDGSISAAFRKALSFIFNLLAEYVIRRPLPQNRRLLWERAIEATDPSGANSLRSLPLHILELLWRPCNRDRILTGVNVYERLVMPTAEFTQHGQRAPYSNICDSSIGGFARSGLTRSLRVSLTHSQPRCRTPLP